MSKISRGLPGVGWFPWAVFLTALVVRAIPILLSSHLSIGLDDMFQYDMLARSLVAGNGFRWYAQNDLYLVQQYIHLDLTNVDYDPRGVLTTFRAPLYPAFLATVYFFSGTGLQRFFAARLAQACVGAALAPLTYFTALHLLPENRRAARLAAWVIAFYPMLIIYPLALATENLFFVLVLAAVLVLLIAADRPTPANFALAGVMLGLAALTRSTILSVAAMAVLWVWFVLSRRASALILLAAMTLTVLPWVVRNTLISGRLTGIETSLGYNLYVGYHPASMGTFTYGPSLDLLTVLDDSTRDRIGTQRALAFIQADPARVPYLALLRLGYFFGLERRALTYFYSNDFLGFIPLTVLLAAAFVILIPFIAISTCSALGLASVPRRPAIGLVALIICGYLLPHILILSEDRFHLTLVPLLAILAAQFWTGGIPALRASWNQSMISRLGVVLAGLAILLLFANWGLELHTDAAKIALLLGPHGNQTYFAY